MLSWFIGGFCYILLHSFLCQTAHLSGGDSNKGSIICPVTRKGIISQKAVLIKRYCYVIWDSNPRYLLAHKLLLLEGGGG